MRTLLSFLIAIFILSACNSNTASEQQSSKSEQANQEDIIHHVTLKEIIQTSVYSYMLVTEENSEYWIAVNKINLEPGFQFYFEGGLEMRDFESKELDRIFEKILFVETITDVPISSKSLTQAAHGMPKQSNTKNNIELEIPEGSTTIEQIFRDKDILNGKQVTVTGKVVKVNEGILKMNWIHIQDGTQNEGDFDLTVTTSEMFKVGDIVTLVGTVTKDKDYGHGYFYNVILEEAKSK